MICILNFLFSDGWAKDDLIYKWKEKDPVQVVKDLHLPRFTLEQYKSAYCDVKTNTGTNNFKYSAKHSIIVLLQANTVALR